MKREKYNFPFPKRERVTGACSLDDGLMDVTFLEVDRSSVSAPVSYSRFLQRKARLNRRFQERQILVSEHEPEIYEREPVVPQEVVREKVAEARPVTKIIVKKREVKDIRPPVIPVQKMEETLQELPSYDRVSVVMALRGTGRLECIKKCIKTLRDQTTDCYIIVVEQDSSPVCQSELETLVDSYLFTYSRAMFNKSWAFNCGAILASDELILLHDCDVLVPKNYIKESIKILGTKDVALPWVKIFYLTEESSKRYPEGNQKISATLSSNQAVGGSLLVRRDFYLRIGGMDERFEGWGGEDNAFYAKACKLGRVARASSATGISLFHHYHELAQKSHAHNHINNHILWEYYHRSDRDILIRIRTLDPIGDPFKYKSMEGNPLEPQLIYK